MLIALYAMFEAKRRATGELHTVAWRRWPRARRPRGRPAGDAGEVDPELLFDTLLAVDRAYARSIRSGEEALDALIGFLRAALPAEAAATSTVARELEHVRAYLAVRELLSASRPDVEMRAEPAAREAPMPAMLMLPLVRWALDGRPTVRLQLMVRRSEGALAFQWRATWQKRRPPRRRPRRRAQALMHLYRERGRLDVSIDAGKRRAVMEIPLQPL